MPALMDPCSRYVVLHLKNYYHYCIGEQGGVRGCRPPPVSIFMTPPPQEGLFDPLAEFWYFDWQRGFLRKNFENYRAPQKKFSPAKFFFSEIAKS